MGYFVLVLTSVAVVTSMNLDPALSCGRDNHECIQAYEDLMRKLAATKSMTQADSSVDKPCDPVYDILCTEPARSSTEATITTTAEEEFSVTSTTRPLHDVFDLRNVFGELQGGSELTIRMRNGEQVILVRKESQWWENWHTMSWSSLWHTVPFAIMCLIIGAMLMVIYPAIRYGLVPLVMMVFTGLGYIVKKLTSSYCWSVTCAGKPIVFVRKLARRCWLNYWVCAKVKAAEEMVPFDEIVIGKSKFKSDEQGMYLETEGVKIYLDIGQDNMLATAPFLKRDDREEALYNTKETIVTNSKYYKADCMPAFQGWFEVSGIVIGYYSRIDYNGRDCLLTAFHVLEYNKMADIMICTNSAKIHFNTLEMKIVSFSRSRDLDYVLMEFPSKTFSILGLKVGKIAQTCGLGTPVSVYQLKNVRNQMIPCFSTGCVQKDARSWYFKHGASTTVGCSGAPVINVRRQIVGIHVEGGDSTFNCGVIPPFLRVKESPQNDDVVSGDNIPEDDSDDEDYDEDEESSVDEFGDSRNKKGRRARRHERDLDAERALVMQEEDTRANLKAKAWFEIVEEEEELQGFRNSSVRKYKHAPVRAEFYMPESPWTCTSCYVTQEHHGTTCIQCGNPLVPVVIRKHKAETAVQTVAQMKENGEGLPYPVMTNIEKQLEGIVERLSKLEKIETFFSNCVDKVGFGYYSADAVAELTSGMRDLQMQVLEMDEKMVKWFKHKPPRDQVQSIPTTATTKAGLILSNTAVETLALTNLEKDERGRAIPASHRTTEIPVVAVTRVKDSEKRQPVQVSKEQKVASLKGQEKLAYEQACTVNQEVADRLLEWNWKTKLENDKRKNKMIKRRQKKKEDKKETLVPPGSEQQALN